MAGQMVADINETITQIIQDYTRSPQDYTISPQDYTRSPQGPQGPHGPPPVLGEDACANVGPNGSIPELTLDYTLAGTTTVVCGSLSFLFILPFVLFQIRKFPIGTTTAVLTGACLMVISNVLTQQGVYQLLGETENLRTIFLLLGMMILSQFFERENMIGKLLKMILKESLSFTNYLWRVNIVTFIFSALFTNDAACVVLTPIFLNHWEKQNRRPAELQTLLLAIATSANIGSVTTIFGNPQMALIASRTDNPLHRQSTLTLIRSIIYLGVPAIIAFFINWGFLTVHYRVREKLKIRKYGPAGCKPQKLKEKEMKMMKLYGEDTEGEPLSLEDNRAILNGHSNSRSNIDAENGAGFPIDGEVALQIQNKKRREKKITQEQHTGNTAYSYEQSHSRPFKVFLVVVIVAVITLMFIKIGDLSFDIGLVPMAGATICLVVDAAMNKRNASVIMGRVDWGVIMMFFGIFVWLHGINTTRIPRWIWKQMGLANASLDSMSTIATLCVFVIFCSNIFSNVPLTIIVLDQLEPCKNQFGLVLYLAWCATIAGNLTLFGSVANLLVAQKAKETLDEPLTFMGYLKYGFVTTMIIVVIGIPIIYGLLLI